MIRKLFYCNCNFSSLSYLYINAYYFQLALSAITNIYTQHTLECNNYFINTNTSVNYTLTYLNTYTNIHLHVLFYTRSLTRVSALRISNLLSHCYSILLYHNNIYLKNKSERIIKAPFLKNWTFLLHVSN